MGPISPLHHRVTRRRYGPIFSHLGTIIPTLPHSVWENSLPHSDSYTLSQVMWLILGEFLLDAAYIHLQYHHISLCTRKPFSLYIWASYSPSRYSYMLVHQPIRCVLLGANLNTNCHRENKHISLLQVSVLVTTKYIKDPLSFLYSGIHQIWIKKTLLIFVIIGVDMYSQSIMLYLLRISTVFFP